jgi:hypothetical protein
VRNSKVLHSYVMVTQRSVGTAKMFSEAWRPTNIEIGAQAWLITITTFCCKH